MIDNVRDYSSGARRILSLIPENITVNKVAYRVVHGGDIKSHTLITNKVLRKIKKVSSLAPLHNLPFLEIFRVLKQKIENAKHIACFDTAFHRTMPEVAKIYAIPMKLTKKYDIQRYGFHGLAHEYMAKKARKYSKVITCQLGNGVSITAVKNGKSIDTSMGFTPLEGLEMGTRSGSIDPALVAFLAEKERKNAKEIVKILERESGLKGIAGDSDVRNLLKRKDRLVKLALDIFVYGVRKYIGAYTQILNGLDCIVLGGGISKSPVMRKRILQGIKAKVVVVDTDEQEIMHNISKRF
jgi:acetate kinase